MRWQRTDALTLANKTTTYVRLTSTVVSISDVLRCETRNWRFNAKHTICIGRRPPRIM